MIVNNCRSDFTTLEFQAIECYLAGVTPVDGVWSVEACELFSSVATNKILEATVVGTSPTDNMPMVDLTMLEGNEVRYNTVVSTVTRSLQRLDVARLLVNAGHAVESSPASSK